MNDKVENPRCVIQRGFVCLCKKLKDAREAAHKAHEKQVDKKAKQCRDADRLYSSGGLGVVYNKQNQSDDGQESGDNV